MNWPVIKALHQIYTSGRVSKKQTLLQDSEINFHVRSSRLLKTTHSYIESQDGFTEMYEQKYLHNYVRYVNFLAVNQLEKPQTRFEKEDIEKLIEIKGWMDDGSLDDVRKQIIANDESIRGISYMFFKNEKYLLHKLSLVDALKHLLQVTHFSNEKDQQYIYKLECHNTKAIVLCENLDFLTKPNRPRKYGIELWFAGGKNIQKLHFADRRGLPIYYSCDWDHDGLHIYQAVKKIIPEISILFPSGVPRSIQVSEHESLWKTTESLSGLESDLFSAEEATLINQLIESNQWIIEESNDLIKMLQLDN